MGKPLKSWRPRTEVIRFLLEEALAIYQEYREVFSKEQPLPAKEELQKHHLALLDGCLGSIRQQLTSGRYLYRPGLETAAAYFYFINKSHWLPNGNKRSAMIISLYYLKKHRKWLRMDWNTLYFLAMEVANYQGKPQVILRKIRKIFREALVNYRGEGFEVFLDSWKVSF